MCFGHGRHGNCELSTTWPKRIVKIANGQSYLHMTLGEMMFLANKCSCLRRTGIIYKQILSNFLWSDNITLAVCETNASRKMSSSKIVTNPVIGYVHKLSPLKQGKKKQWCDLESQMKEKRTRVVCFSKAKRDIFLESKRRLFQFRLTTILSGQVGDGEKIKVNDMTVVASPTTSQYNFQYIPDEGPTFVSLNEVKKRSNLAQWCA